MSKSVFLTIPWNRVILEKLTVTQLVKKFTTFYWTWKFITMFTRTHLWSQSWTKLIQIYSFYFVVWIA